ncbi:MAG: hypothetical protein WC373_09135 [Smithella sp.]|jgi:hypothetical protein
MTKKLSLITTLIILLTASLAFAVPPSPPSSTTGATINDSAGNGDNTVVYSADKVFDLLALKQAALSLIAGTYTNGYLCKYTAAGTLLDCNVDPAGYQSSDTELTAIADLANGAGALTNDGAGAMSWVAYQASNTDLSTLAAGGTANCLWGEKSDSSGIECKTTINILADDSGSHLKDNTDATKQVRWILDDITTGNTRQIKPPNANGTLPLVDGDNTFTGANTIGDGGDDQRIVSRINATNERWSGHTIYFAQCAATLAFGTPVYIQSTGKPAAADADAAATMPAIGLIVVASTDADTPCTVLTHGVITDTDWNFTTVGATIYTSETAGSVELSVTNITDTNDVVQVLGIALHGDTLFVNPSLTTVVLE